MDENTIEGHLGAAFDELVGATHLTKQVLWAGPSPQRDQLQGLLAFLGEQARLVDEAEAQVGGRAADLSSPSGRRRPNLLGAVDNDAPAALAAYVTHLRGLVDDLRQRAKDMGTGSGATLLLGVASGLETRLSDMSAAGTSD
ncbi:MAG: hypothetical protein ABI239_10100 [Aquihabitans sp.]